MAQGGDIREITWAHPTLGTGVFLPKAGESNTFDPGGFRNADDANMIDGAGNIINTKNRVRGKLEVVVADDPNTREDLYNAIALAESSVHADWTVEMLNGSIYQGTGPIVGDLQKDVNAATFPLNIAVPQWIKQS